MGLPQAFALGAACLRRDSSAISRFMHQVDRFSGFIGRPTLSFHQELAWRRQELPTALLRLVDKFARRKSMETRQSASDREISRRRFMATTSALGAAALLGKLKG